jgi:hypothetical protein
MSFGIVPLSMPHLSSQSSKSVFPLAIANCPKKGIVTLLVVFNLSLGIAMTKHMISVLVDKTKESYCFRPPERHKRNQDNLILLTAFLEKILET